MFILQFVLEEILVALISWLLESVLKLICAAVRLLWSGVLAALGFLARRASCQLLRSR